MHAATVSAIQLRPAALPAAGQRQSFASVHVRSSHASRATGTGSRLSLRRAVRTTAVVTDPPGSAKTNEFKRPNRSHPEWEGIPLPPKPIDIELRKFSRGSRDKPFDILIVGCGPGGLSAAARAAEKGLRVGVIDPNPNAPWRNNYGVWVDEFEAMGLGDCFSRSWDVARVILDDKNPRGMPLDRPYAQVDRFRLKSKLMRAAHDAGCEFLVGKVADVDHEERLSSVSVRGGDKYFGRAILDATGHARRLVKFASDFTPGYQAAYGILVEVESHPYPVDEMLFMDWRDEHLDAAAKERNRSLPSFLYVMPFGPTRIFAEETSLVARPGLDFDDVKLRMKQRFEKQGIKVVKVLEEEHCFIPMGGVLPMQPQRTLGIGGTAGMVHPSTGFMLSLTLKSANVLVDALQKELKAQDDAEAKGTKIPTGDDLSKAVWKQIWPDTEKRIRTFMCFGMETLLQLDIKGTRRFFGTFFSLPKETWSAFLSWRIKPVGLLDMGLSLMQKFETGMRVEFVLSALPFVPSLLANFVPATNRFTSRPWSGLVLPQMRRPEPAPSSNLELAKWLSGNIQILPPQPTSGPILSSSVDFASLIGVEPALAGGKEDVDDPILETDYEALLGRDLKVPLPVSQSRSDASWVQFQQRKILPDQRPIAEYLPPLAPGSTVDVVVVGCGPAGLALAAALGDRGLAVGLVGPDSNFVNTYGVWTDEFEELGLEHTLSNAYADGMYWIDEASPNEGIAIGRRYGRVDRAKLREELLGRAKRAGVLYMDGIVHGIDNEASGVSVVSLDGERTVTAKISALACGHNKELLEYEDKKPGAWQTAYGIEISMPDHPFAMDRAVFMDFRQSDPDVTDGADQWRVPSFLYVLPTDKDTVFLEETCLMSRVQVPFDELKRRLYRRMARMGLPLSPEAVLEEEASWIPLGGGLPKMPQRNIAFGAAAGLVHPGSGFSLYNSFRSAKEVAGVIADNVKAGTPELAAAAAYEVLWSEERMKRMGFYQFGMEMVLSLDVRSLRNFFSTFYRLPFPLAHGFLSHRLSSAQLLGFAFAFFVYGNNELRGILLKHLVSPAGSGNRLAKAYLSAEKEEPKHQSVERKNPPQMSALALATEEQRLHEEAGFTTGFQTKKWWLIK